MRKIVNALLFSVLIASCSSELVARAEWYTKDVSKNKRIWRYCSEDKDGPGKHEKGFCYISQRCIKKVFRDEACEPVPMFCVHGDIECLRINNYPQIKRGL